MNKILSNKIFEKLGFIGTYKCLSDLEIRHYTLHESHQSPYSIDWFKSYILIYNPMFKAIEIRGSHYYNSHHYIENLDKKMEMLEDITLYRGKCRNKKELINILYYLNIIEYWNKNLKNE